MWVGKTVNLDGWNYAFWHCLTFLTWLYSCTQFWPVKNFVFKNKGLFRKRLLRFGLTQTSFFFGIKPALVLLYKPFQLLNLNKTVSLWCMSLTSASSKIWLWTARHTTTCVPQDTSPLDYWKICLVSSCHLPHLV